MDKKSLRKAAANNTQGAELGTSQTPILPGGGWVSMIAFGVALMLPRPNRNSGHRISGMLATAEMLRCDLNNQQTPTVPTSESVVHHSNQSLSYNQYPSHAMQSRVIRFASHEANPSPPPWKIPPKATIWCQKQKQLGLGQSPGERECVIRNVCKGRRAATWLFSIALVSICTTRLSWSSAASRPVPSAR